LKIRGISVNLPTVPIITYHAIENLASPLFTSPTVFEAQLAALAESGYQAISMATVFDWLQGDISLLAKAVVITFDDGYASVYDSAWPRLQAYDFSATVFLVTGYCGGGNQWPGQMDGVPKRGLLTWDQVSELAAAGWEFGAHTRTHPPLPGIPTDQAEEEILTSREEIESRIGQTVRSFAYPYGASSPDVQAIVQRFFDGALGVRLGLVTAASNAYCLERIDAFYLAPRFIPFLGRPGFRQYLNLRQWMREVRRRVRPDWHYSSHDPFGA
jgi:peptidoglycan/xylan/chitin deacetylase (PgdA/CDA1 family)